VETYFANLEGAALTAALLERVRVYQRFILRSGYWGLGAKSVQFVCGMDAKGYSSFSIRRTGPRGEYAKLKVDEYSSLYNNFSSSLLGQKIVFEPQPRGEDWKASEQARKGRGVLESDLDAGLREVLLDAADYAIQMGMAYTAVDFDPDGGDPMLPDPDGGPPVRAGKMTWRAYMPQDAATDCELRHPADGRWWILRRWEDAHDLAARHPERADEIMAARGGGELEREVEIQDLVFQGFRDKTINSSRVPLYEFRHDPSPACPNGRIAWFLNGGGAPLFVTDLPFVDEEGHTRSCVRPLFLNRIPGTALGWTPIWLLMAPQELLDMLQSIEATNYKAHGVGVILNPRGSDITPKKIGTGLAILDYTPGLEPKLANFTAMPPDIAGAQERTVGTMQRLLGVSAVDRGDPPPNVKSGSAMLFLKATTAQALQRYQNKISAHHEGVAEDDLFLYVIFVRTPRPITIRGEVAERTEEVSGQDIGGPLRVKLQVGNPLTHSITGQIQIAENLLAQQAITAAEYLEIVDGAGLEKLLARSTSQRILVEQENSMLRRGEAPLVSPTHDPLYHIAHHALELNSQQALANPAIRNAVLNHIDMHQKMWAVATLQNPGMLEALGIPLLQAALGMVGGMPPGPEGQGGAPAAPPPSPGAVEGPADGGRMPKPPRLPPGAAAATGVNPQAPGPGGAP
jgi:hypothetical protein